MSNSATLTFFLSGIAKMTDVEPTGQKLERCNTEPWRLKEFLKEQAGGNIIVATTAFFNIHTLQLEPCQIIRCNVQVLEEMSQEGLITTPEYWAVDPEVWMKMF